MGLGRETGGTDVDTEMGLGRETGGMEGADAWAECRVTVLEAWMVVLLRMVVVVKLLVH